MNKLNVSCDWKLVGSRETSSEESDHSKNLFSFCREDNLTLYLRNAQLSTLLLKRGGKKPFYCDNTEVENLEFVSRHFHTWL